MLDAWHDLVLYVQSKKREKPTRRSVTFNKVAGKARFFIGNILIFWKRFEFIVLLHEIIV